MFVKKLLTLLLIVMVTALSCSRINHDIAVYSHQAVIPVLKNKEQNRILRVRIDTRRLDSPVNITRMCKKEEWWLLAPAPGHGITLDDGTLVFPAQGRDSKGKAFSDIIYSADGGKTWHTGNPAFYDTNENMVAQLSDGTIMLNARYRRNNNNAIDTNGRVVMVTENIGETWPDTCRLLLDEERSRGYSCITSIDEKTIGILYESSQADLVFESIPLTEITDNKQESKAGIPGE